MTYDAAPVEQLACRRLWLGLEPRAPIAERLDRNPVSFAILSLIELALKPRFMMRPAKRHRHNVLELTAVVMREQTVAQRSAPLSDPANR